MNLENVNLIIKIAIGALAVLSTVATGLWKWCPRIINLFKRKKSILLVNDDSGYQNFWHIGSTGGQNPRPLLQISCKFMVTNITDQPVALAQATWRGVKGEAETAIVSVKDLRSIYWGDYDIPPRAKTDVSIDFMIAAKKRPKAGESIKLDIGVIDQYGNSHWIRKVLFRSS